MYNFITNLRLSDKDLFVRVAEKCKLDYKIVDTALDMHGRDISHKGYKSFHVNRNVLNLSQFWSLIRKAQEGEV